MGHRRWRNWLGAGLFAVAVWARPTLVLAGELDEAREDVRRERPRQSSTEPRGQGTSSQCGRSEDDDEGSFLGDLLASIFFPRSWRSHQGNDVEYELDARMLFAHHPYADGLDGYMMREDWVPARPLLGTTRFWFEYGDNFDGLTRYAGKLLVDTRSRFGIDGDWNYYTENLGGGRRDDLHVGDVNLLYRFAETPNVQLHAGAGLNWMYDPGRIDLGMNFTLRADLFPVRPLILSSEFDGGWLGHAGMVHAAVSAGVNYRHVELFAGYDYREIGSADLAGPMLGGRIWY
jgi:hypothetical protein